MDQKSQAMEMASRFLKALDALFKLTPHKMPSPVMKQLNFNQHHALRLLFEQSGISQKDLAERLEITPAAVSTAIREMESFGLVERHPDPADARQVQLFLSEQARNLIKQGHEMRCGAVANVLDALAIEEQQVIVELLERALTLKQSHISPGDET